MREETEVELSKVYLRRELLKGSDSEKININSNRILCIEIMKIHEQIDRNKGKIELTFSLTAGRTGDGEDDLDT